ncbi:MAG TPA: phenazine biosynthesis FMN-dependent oxidase PhzG [Solirubrobacterales bacterium]|nr:phenazine biosynthesis FMN-dependent oxidase PhzG [Solirubrobacterales bacterium]
MKAIETLSGDVELDLPEFDTPPADPLGLLTRWLEEAREHGVREPRALALATAGADGRPSSRVVLLKEVEPALVFTSHYDSRKGRDLATVAWASGVLYWRETMQQVVVEGPVERISAAESDALFTARPRAAQAATLVSEQSKELDDPEALRTAMEELASGEEPLSRPPNWGGYRMSPELIEFWHGSADRLHRRLLYTKAEAGWSHQRIQP